jgi:hypothetical protein
MSLLIETGCDVRRTQPARRQQADLNAIVEGKGGPQKIV